MAQAQEVAIDTATMAGEVPPPPNDTLWTIIMMVFMIVAFYFLLIRPQSKRMAAHKQMVSELKKGDRVVTAGGLVGKIDKLTSDEEVVIDLGGTKVTALRHTIQTTTDKTPVAVKEEKKKPAKKK